VAAEAIVAADHAIGIVDEEVTRDGKLCREPRRESNATVHDTRTCIMSLVRSRRSMRSLLLFYSVVELLSLSSVAIPCAV
jgi:hypothetical protein